jgi:hypothetical protein
MPDQVLEVWWIVDLLLSLSLLSLLSSSKYYCRLLPIGQHAACGTVHVVCASLSPSDNSEAAAFQTRPSPFDVTALAAIHLTDPTLSPILDSKSSKANQYGHSSSKFNPLVSTQTASPALLPDHRKACI